MFISLIKRKIILATFFVILIGGTFFATPPKRAHAALFGLVDLGEVKEYVLDPLFYVINEIFIERLTQSAVNWIDNGFKTDENWTGPAFLDDPGKYFENLADEEAGRLINQYVPELCSPFSLKIKVQLEVKYLQKQERPKSVRCTFTDVKGNAEQAWEDFSNDFDNGGWARWIELTARPTNNAYGAYIRAENNIASKLAERVGLKKTELEWSRGFKGVEKCYQKAIRGSSGVATRFGPDGEVANSSTENDVWIDPATGSVVGSGNGPAPCIDSRTVTPGTAVQDTLNNALGTTWGRLEVADEFNEIVGALLSQLVNKATKGLGEIARSESGGERGVLASIREEIDAVTGNVQEELREYVHLKEVTLDRMGSFDVIPAVLGPLESGMIKVDWMGDSFEWVQTQDQSIGYTRTFGEVNRYSCNENTAEKSVGQPGKRAWSVTPNREWAWSECKFTLYAYESLDEQGDTGVINAISNLNPRYAYVPLDSGRSPATLIEFTNVTADSETVKVAWGELNREVEEEFNWTTGVYYTRTGRENPRTGTVDYTYNKVSCSVATEGVTAYVVDDSTRDANNNPFPVWKEVTCENVSTGDGIYVWEETESLNFAKSIKALNRNGRFATEISWDGFFLDWDQFTIYNIGRQDAEADSPGEGVDGGLDLFPWDPRKIFDATAPHVYDNANTCGRGGDPDKREGDRNKLEIGFAVDSIGTKQWKKYECNRQRILEHLIGDVPDQASRAFSYFRWKERETLDDAYVTIDFLGSEASKVLKNGDQNVTRLYDQLEQCYVPAAATGNAQAQRALENIQAKRQLRIFERAKVAHEALVGQHFLDQVEVIKSDTSQIGTTDASYNLLERLERITDSLENGYQTLDAEEHYKQIEEENEQLVQRLRDCQNGVYGGETTILPVNWDGDFFRWAYDTRYTTTGSGVQAVQGNSCTSGTVGENYMVPSNQPGAPASWRWFSRTCTSRTVQTGTGEDAQQSVQYEWDDSDFQRNPDMPIYKNENEVLEDVLSGGIPPKGTNGE